MWRKKESRDFRTSIIIMYRSWSWLKFFYIFCWCYIYFSCTRIYEEIKYGFQLYLIIGFTKRFFFFSKTTCGVNVATEACGTSKMCAFVGNQLLSFCFSLRIRKRRRWKGFVELKNFLKLLQPLIFFILNWNKFQYCNPCGWWLKN